MLRRTQSTKEKHKLSPPREGPYTVTEVIQPGTYRLEDNNGNVLNNTWNIEQLRRFFPLKSAPGRMLSTRVARGLHKYTNIEYYLSVLFTAVWKIPSYPNEGVVHSFKFTLCSFALKIPTNCTPPFPMATTGRASWAMPQAREVATYGTNRQV